VFVGGVRLGGLRCCSCRVRVCVGVEGVVLCRCVCVCDLLIVLPEPREGRGRQQEQEEVGHKVCEGGHAHGADERLQREEGVALAREEHLRNQNLRAGVCL